MFVGICAECGHEVKIWSAFGRRYFYCVGSRNMEIVCNCSSKQTLLDSISDILR